MKRYFQIHCCKVERTFQDFLGMFYSYVHRSRAVPNKRPLQDMSLDVYQR